MGNRLASGATLHELERLDSAGGQMYLIMQGDGNLVSYQTASGTPVWASDTMGSGAISAVMQPDGDFVLLDGAGAQIWSVGSGGNPGAQAMISDDGNLLVADATGGVVLWYSNPSTLAVGFQYEGTLRIVQQLAHPPAGGENDDQASARRVLHQAAVMTALAHLARLDAAARKQVFDLVIKIGSAGLESVLLTLMTERLTGLDSTVRHAQGMAAWDDATGTPDSGVAVCRLDQDGFQMWAISPATVSSMRPGGNNWGLFVGMSAVGFSQGLERLASFALSANVSRPADLQSAAIAKPPPPSVSIVGRGKGAAIKWDLSSWAVAFSFEAMAWGVVIGLAAVPGVVVAPALLGIAVGSAIAGFGGAAILQGLHSLGLDIPPPVCVYVGDNTYWWGGDGAPAGTITVIEGMDGEPGLVTAPEGGSDHQFYQLPEEQPLDPD